MGSRAGRNFRGMKADSKNVIAEKKRERGRERRESKLVIGSKVGRIQRGKRRTNTEI